MLKIKVTLLLLWELIRTFLDEHYGKIVIMEMILLFALLSLINRWQFK